MIVGEKDFYPVDDRARVQPEVCGSCALRGPCPGLYRGYREAYGDGELMPRQGAPQSNSFHYVREARAGAVRGGRCPVLDDGVLPWDRARHLFLRDGVEVDRYRTESRDFADVEIAADEARPRAIYLDASTKAAVDDFPADLVPLRRSDLCASCPEEKACAGMYEPAPSDVFRRDDRRVRSWPS